LYVKKAATNRGTLSKKTQKGGYFEGLKTGHYDFLNLIEQGYAISVDSLEKDPYKEN
jgi:hypothetical protein